MSTTKHVPDMARPSGLDDPINKALVEIDPDKQKALLKQVSKLLYDVVTFIPIYLEMRRFIIDKDVHDYNFYFSTMPGAGAFTNTWKSKR